MYLITDHYDKAGKLVWSDVLDHKSADVKREYTDWLASRKIEENQQAQDKFGIDQRVRQTDILGAQEFWAALLFYPLDLLSTTAPLVRAIGGNRLCIYNIIQAGHGDSLKKTNLGVVYHPDKWWLSLIWSESAKIRKRMSVQSKLVRLFEKNLRARNNDVDDFWRATAESSSFCVPKRRLIDGAHVRKRLHFRTTLTRDDVVVINMLGIELGVTLQANKIMQVYEDTRGCEPFRVRFDKLLTDGTPEELRAQRKALKKEFEKDRYQRDRQRRLDAQKKRRELRKIQNDPRRPENVGWHQSTRAIFSIAGNLEGVSKRGGRWPKFADGDRAAHLLDECLHAYACGGRMRSQAVLAQSIRTLKEFAADPKVPDEFQDWLIWDDKQALDDLRARKGNNATQDKKLETEEKE